MRRSWFLQIGLVLLATSATAQQTDTSRVELKVIKVAGQIYMLEGVGGFAGGNVGVSIGEDGILIVDDQFAPMVPKIQAALKSVSDKPIKFVLNTHWHGDHTGGNQVLGGSTTIVAHSNVRTRLEKQGFGLGPGQPSVPAPPAALPVITFDDKLSVHLNGEEICAIHFPRGHTDGDVVIYFTRSNVVHMGDDFFNGMFPFIDIDNGGSVKGYVANVAKVLAELTPGARIIPGHGPLATADDLKAYATMLKETVTIVESGIRSGKTLEEMESAKVLAAYEERWGKGFMKADRFLETVHRDLKP